MDADYKGVKDRSDQEAAAGWPAGWHQRVFGEDFPEWDPEKEGFDADVTWPVQLKAKKLPPVERLQEHWLEGLEPSRTMPPYVETRLPIRRKPLAPWVEAWLLRERGVTGDEVRLHEVSEEENEVEYEGTEEEYEGSEEEYEGSEEEYGSGDEDDEEYEGEGSGEEYEGTEEEFEGTEEGSECESEDQGEYESEEQEEYESDEELVAGSDSGEETDVEELFALDELVDLRARVLRGEESLRDEEEGEDHGEVVARTPVGDGGVVVKKSERLLRAS